MPQNDTSKIRIGLPKGRMEKGVIQLLSDAGIDVHFSSRVYRPVISLPEFEAKLLKPQDIVEMLNVGSRDIGFAGADWVKELNADLVELLDTEMDRVRLVAAAPTQILENGKLPSGTSKPLIVASEYQRITTKWIAEKGINATFVRSYGATEVFPPEDADCIVDNTSTGSTLHANNLEIIDELMQSSTRLYANPRVLDDPAKREIVERFVLLIKSVHDARSRVMIEVNVGSEDLERVVGSLPSMKEPTVSRLHGDIGYVVKAAVPRAELPRLIPEIKAAGGTDLVVSLISQLVP